MGREAPAVVKVRRGSGGVQTGLMNQDFSCRQEHADGSNEPHKLQQMLISSPGPQRLSEGSELEPVAEVRPVGSFPGRRFWGIRADVSVP